MPSRHVTRNTYKVAAPLTLEGYWNYSELTKYVKNVKIEEIKSRLEQLLERFHYFYIFENMVFVLLLLGRACFQK